MSPELSHKLEVLRAHCAEVGRPYEEIEKSVLYSPDPTLDGVAGALEELARLGVDQEIVSLSNVYEQGVIETFAERAVPVAAGLVIAG